MVKKTWLLLIVLVGGLSSLSAEGNTISGGIGGGFTIPAVFVSDVFIYYDRDIVADFFSVGVGAAAYAYPLGLAVVAIDKDKFSAGGWKADARVRFYPWSGIFHLGLGLGYANYMKAVNELVVTPALGWKIKVGSGGFVVDLGIQVEIFMGKGFKYDNGESILKPGNLLASVALGYRF